MKSRKRKLRAYRKKANGKVVRRNNNMGDRQKSQQQIHREREREREATRDNAERNEDVERGRGQKKDGGDRYIKKKKKYGNVTEKKSMKARIKQIDIHILQSFRLSFIFINCAFEVFICIYSLIIF